MTDMPNENNVAAQAGDEPMRAAFEAAKDGLELYAESYDMMSRMGDGKVHCTSVAFDIRRNMVDAVAKALVSPRATADVERYSIDEICQASVKAGLGILECNSLIVTLKGA